MKKKVSRKWILFFILVVIGIILYLWLTPSVTIGQPSKYCETDSDCKSTCFCGCINKDDICREDYRVMCKPRAYECRCVNNRCEEVINECEIKSPDPDGYLLKICKYLQEHKDTIIPNKNPDEYSIKEFEEGEYQGKDVLVIRLDCCYMGDLAYVDKETKEVIGFSPGDI